MLLFLKTQKNKEKLLIELKSLEDKVKNNLSSLQVKHYDVIKHATIDDPREYKQRLTHFRKIMSSLNAVKRFEYKFDQQGYLVSSIIDEVLEKALYETGIRKKLDTRKAEEEAFIEEMKKLAEVLKTKEISIKVKTGEQDKVFGTVSSKQICEELKKQDINIDKKKIIIDTPIDTLGTHIVKIQLHKKVEGEIKVILKK